MNDSRAASVADAIASKLTANGDLPDGGMFAEIHYTAVAKVTVYDADGTPSTSYRFFDNLAGDVDTKHTLAHRMVWECERQAGKG